MIAKVPYAMAQMMPFKLHPVLRLGLVQSRHRRNTIEPSSLKKMLQTKGLKTAGI